MPPGGRGKRRLELTDPNAAKLAFGNRLKLLAGYWPSAERLARASGVSPSAFRKWIRGEAEPSRDRLIALSDTAGVTLDWLIRGQGPDPVPTSIPGDHLADATAGGRGETDGAASDFVFLPSCPEAAAAGAGEPSAGPARRFIGFRADWIREALGTAPNSVELETAVGDSMSPGIGDGDLLLVDTSVAEITEFGIYVVEVRGERVVKRVQRRFDGSLVLISDNTRYLAEVLPPEVAAEVTVIGRVVWRGGVL